MNTQNDFLDNAVDDELAIDRTEDLNAEMCSSLRSDTCGDGMFIVQTSCRPTY